MGNSTIWVDVSPIKNGGFPASYVGLPEGRYVYPPNFTRAPNFNNCKKIPPEFHIHFFRLLWNDSCRRRNGFCWVGGGEISLYTNASSMLQNDWPLKNDPKCSMKYALYTGSNFTNNTSAWHQIFLSHLKRDVEKTIAKVCFPWISLRWLD